MQKPSERIEEALWINIGTEIRLDMPRALREVGKILDELSLDKE